jgi:transcriptional repressor NrdR
MSRPAFGPQKTASLTKKKAKPSISCKLPGLFGYNAASIHITLPTAPCIRFLLFFGTPHVQCPYCKHDETKVIDSRNSQDFSIRRRRECLSCERRFTTYEKIEESPIRVIKKDGTRVPFDRVKIRRGVEVACYKRPVSPEQIDLLVGDVEAALYEDGEREVPSRRIGELVFSALRDLDKVAFVRFASVYREFQDVHDFVDELQPILDGRRREM